MLSLAGRSAFDLCFFNRPPAPPTSRYVHVRGVRNELTHGASQGDGSYGTSIPYEAASNPASDVLIAYAMNDEPLPPDHGYPVRLIVPGFIGGRMVKYLEEVTVAAEV